MTDAGQACWGSAWQPARRGDRAAEQAVSSPLLETSVEGARSILLSITGGPDLSLWESQRGREGGSEAAHPSANIIFGAMIDDKVEEECWVTVVATGLRRPAAAPIRSLDVPRARRGNRGSGGPGRVRSSRVPEFVPGGSSLEPHVFDLTSTTPSAAL